MNYFFELELNSYPIYGPKTVPIGDILNDIQARADDPNFKNEMICQNISNTSPFGACTFCATVDQLSIEGDTLNYCGIGQFTCNPVFVPEIRRNFTIPCVKIDNCQLFSCKNDCNGRGKCTSLGMCECYSGYYGYDCLLEMTDNCISGANFQQTCWDISFPDCREVDIQVTSAGTAPSMKHEKVDELSSFSIGPCRDVISEDKLKCEICMEMNDVTTLGTQLIGCPTIRSVCNDVTVGEDSMDCITLAQSTQLTCNPDDKTNEQTGGFSRSKILLTFVSVIIGLGIIGAVIVLLRKYSKFIKGKDRPEVYIEEDEEPLNDDQDSY